MSRLVEAWREQNANPRSVESANLTRGDQQDKGLTQDLNFLPVNLVTKTMSIFVNGILFFCKDLMHKGENGLACG